jgi:hypothetical protein
MKPIPITARGNTLPFLAALVCTSLTAAVSIGTAQVKIPAKSGSSLEESNKETSSTEIAKPAASRFDKRSNVSRSAPEGPKTLTPSNVTPPDPKNLAATKRVPVPKQNLNPAAIARLADLRRELRIAESATQARFALPTEDLFEKTAPTTIDDLSEPTLKKVVEFIALNEKRSVTVKSSYLPDAENGKGRAWTRSLALIEWMTANSSLEPEQFRASTPTPVTVETLRKVAKNVGEGDLVARIEMVLEFRAPENSP